METLSINTLMKCVEYVYSWDSNKYVVTCLRENNIFYHSMISLQSKQNNSTYFAKLAVTCCFNCLSVLSDPAHMKQRSFLCALVQIILYEGSFTNVQKFMKVCFQFMKGDREFSNGPLKKVARSFIYQFNFQLLKDR